VLKRGYAVIRDEEDRPVSQAAALEPGAAIAIEFADGRVAAVTGSGAADTSSSVSQRKKTVRPAETADPPKQGTLF
jgi:exodeoxyribonuclease VII large subunit